MTYEIGDKVVIHDGVSKCIYASKNYDGQIGEITNYVIDDMYEVKFSDGERFPLFTKRFSLYEASSLTIRDQFAMAALTGLSAEDMSESAVAMAAYKLADAMLAERGKEK